MEEQAILDPAASPSRVRAGVRRVNNVPVAILAATVATFLAIMAFVAAGRASDGQGSKEEGPIRSALGIAKDVAGDREAGVIAPASATASQPNAPASAAQTPAAGASQSNIPEPPLRPPLSEDLQDSAAGAVGGQAGSGSGSIAARGGAAPQGGGAQSEEERDLQRMQLEMFKDAIRAPTTTKLEASAAESSAELPGSERIAQARSELAALKSLRGDGADYVDKLRELQAAGLLPEGEEQNKHSTGDYERFAGNAKEDRWQLGSAQEDPTSPYELRAGAVLPATLQTGINSDLPGQITAIVAQDVRDTARGQYVLIPQGSRLVGTYGSDVKFGQERVLVAWQRITWPDGKVLDIGAMPGADGAGYAGFKDLVDTHFWRIFGSALLLSGITGGIAYSQDSQAQSDKVTVGGSMSQALGNQLGQLSEEMIRKQMNVAPTIEVRPGYRFNVQVTKDLVFNGPYEAFDYERSISSAGETFHAR